MKNSSGVHRVSWSNVLVDRRKECFASSSLIGLLRYPHMTVVATTDVCEITEQIHGHSR